MPRKGENIYQRKDRRWEGRYIKGQNEQKTVYGYVYGKTYKECRKKLQEAQIEWKTELKQQSKRRKNNQFSLISSMWLEDMRFLLKESTLAKYRNLLQKYILPAFGKMHMDEITNDDLIAFIHALLRQGGEKRQGLSSRTVSTILTLLNKIKKYAIARNCLVHFSTECVTLKQTPKALRVLSITEEKKLYCYLQSHMTHSNLGILLCLCTGIRLGELCALKWDDISLCEQKMQITKTMQRIQTFDEEKQKTKILISAPKSASSVRTIPLPESTIKKLRTFYVQDAFLLTGTHQYVEPRTMENRFKAVLARCGIENANFHALRHTFATRCIEVGFDVKSLSEILGHANINITLNCYVHPTMEHKKTNMAKLSSWFAVK